MGDVVQPDRLGIVDEHAEHAEPLGQVTDPLPHRRIDALIDELDEFVVVAPNAQRAVLRIDQLDRRVHDGAKSFVELQPRRDHQHRVDQTVQPVAPLDDLLDAVLDLHQQLAKAQLGQRVPKRTHAVFNARPDLVGHPVIVPSANRDLSRKRNIDMDLYAFVGSIDASTLPLTCCR